MTDAQTEARAIVEEYGKRPKTSILINLIATALAAKDAELAVAVGEIERLKNLVGDPQGTVDHAEAFLARAEAAERALAERAGGVKVNPLEWRGTETVWLKADAEFGGIYRITVYAGMPEPFKLETHGWWSGQPCGHYATLNEAKAAAQADYERRILSALTTEPSAPKGRQEAGRIGDAVLDWMVKFDLLDAGNEYYVSDVLAVLNDLTPSTRPAEQAVTEAQITAMVSAYNRSTGYAFPQATDAEQREGMRAAFRAAMEAGR